MQPNNPSYLQAQPCSDEPAFDNVDGEGSCQLPPIHPQAPSIGCRFTRRKLPLFGSQITLRSSRTRQAFRLSVAASPWGTVHRPVGPAHLPTLSGCKQASRSVPSAIGDSVYGAHYIPAYVLRMQEYYANVEANGR